MHYVAVSSTARLVLHDSALLVGLQLKAGEEVVKFTRTSEKYDMRTTIEVDFSDGSHHRFESFGMMAFARVFLSEHGLYHPLNEHTQLLPCTPHEELPYRGSIRTKSSDKPLLTHFMDAYQVNRHTDAIEAGRGITIVTFHDDTVALPHHEIQRFTITEHPFGG